MKKKKKVTSEKKVFRLWYIAESCIFHCCQCFVSLCKKIKILILSPPPLETYKVDASQSSHISFLKYIVKYK